jgi:hypothetical protein
MEEHAKDILAQALQLRDPDERRAWLVRACAGDEALHAEVESLVLDFEQAGDFSCSRA